MRLRSTTTQGKAASAAQEDPGVAQAMPDVLPHPSDAMPVVGALRAASRVRQVDTPEFKRWFGKSKVVDGDGEPLVVFRGNRRVPGAEKFVLTCGRATPAFTADPWAASVYARQLKTVQYDQGSCVTPVFLSIPSPLDMRASGTHDRPGCITVLEALEALGDGAALDLNSDWVERGIGSEDVANMLSRWDNLVDRTLAHVHFDNRFDTFAEVADWMRSAPGDRVERVLASIEVDVYLLADSRGFVDLATMAGFDGVVFSDTFAVGAEFYEGEADLLVEGVEPVVETWRPFRQHQIKSALANCGQFDPENPSILG